MLVEVVKFSGQRQGVIFPPFRLQELQRKKQWDADDVVIVDADMRFWEPPEKVNGNKKGTEDT